MGRGAFIAVSVLGLVVWSWLGYFNIVMVLRAGTPFPYALLSPSTAGPIALVPITLIQLWKLLAAERKENILKPDYVFRASQSLVARAIGSVMCVAFLVAGVWGLLGHPVAAGLPESPVVSMIFTAAGVYGVLFLLFSPRIRIGLSPEGFEYSQMRPARVPWHDITDVRLRSFLTGSWIVVTLKNTTEFRSANLLARWHKVTKVRISPLIFGIDPAVLKQGIDLRRNAFTFD